MSRTPSVDVIVPCYNYGAYVEACVASILDNAGVHIRILLLDDASTDNTAEIGPRLATADSRVTYRRHHQNAGHIATYNEGLQWVNADYVLLISADDLLTSGALARAVDALERHPDAAFAYGGQMHFADPAELANVDQTPHAGITCWPGPDFIGGICTNAQNPVTTPTVVVRTTQHRRVGGYEPTLPHTADMHLWMRLATIGSVVRLESLQAFKRKHAQNMQIGYVRPTEGDVVERRLALDQFFAGRGADLPEASALRASAHLALAIELTWRAANAFDAQDTDTADRLLIVAHATSAAVKGTSVWHRMELKRRMGTHAWSLVKGVVGIGQRLR
jgi:glycosyltransferase involved in cell wall biosynthesis